MNFRLAVLFVFVWFAVVPSIAHTQEIKVVELPHAGTEYRVRKLESAYDWVPAPKEECGPYFLVKRAPSFTHLLWVSEEAGIVGSITMYETLVDDSKDTPTLEYLPPEKWTGTKIRFII